ncbi:CapA family protein [Streptomyces sp. NPDC093225]|uniref:CapA family protein n=1 Tax=Streptomyces sp. NPDC093225 TaxID=3366034 RepID=UPI003822C190
MSKRTRRAAATLTAALLAAGAAGCAAGSAPARLAGGHRPGPSGAAPGSPAAPGRGFTLVASGDVLPHPSVIQRGQADAGGEGYDFRPMFAQVKPVVSASDLALCHMETVYGEEEGPFTGYPAFRSPPQFAEALKDAGYDGCSTASNHSLDDGADGIRRTLERFDRAGLKHAGTARTAAEAAVLTTYAAGTAKVAHLAYTYDTNGYPMPDGQPWAVNLIKKDRILTDARTARAAGADVVLVSVHWGTEWQTEPDELQLSLARDLTAARTAGRPDVDLVLGTHAHVPQAYEKVNGTWVVYGMGDQVSGRMVNYADQPDPRGNYGSIGRFRFEPPTTAGGRWRVTKAEFVPQMMDTDAGRVVDLPVALAAHPDREDYEDALDHIRGAVLSRGAAADGLTMGR